MLPSIRQHALRDWGAEWHVQCNGPYFSADMPTNAAVQRKGGVARTEKRCVYGGE